MNLTIRARLTLWIGAALLLAVGFVAIGLYTVTSAAALRSVDQALNDTADDFLDRLAAEPASLPLRPSLDAAVAHFRYRDRSVTIYGNDGALLASSRVEAPAQLPASERAPHYSWLAGSNESSRHLVRRVRRGGADLLLSVTHATPEHALMLRDVRRALALSIPLAAALALFAALFLANAMLRPARDMIALAEQISEENLSGRIPVTNERDELGRLGRVLNALFARLERSFAEQRRFFADAAHELRTPISIIRGEADLALTRKPRSADEYADALRVISDEARGLTSTVENLFVLARAQVRQLPLEKNDFYLDDLLESVARSFRNVAERVDVVFVPTEELAVHADETLLRRAVTNLVSNAVRHTSAGGRVTLSASRDSGNFEIVVQDDGPGVPEELRERIFDIFVRAATADRREEHRGAGLGLPIARLIARMHGGDVVLRDTSHRGATFVLTLPLR